LYLEPCTYTTTPFSVSAGFRALLALLAAVIGETEERRITNILCIVDEQDHDHDHDENNSNNSEAPLIALNTMQRNQEDHEQFSDKQRQHEIEKKGQKELGDLLKERGEREKAAREQAQAADERARVFPYQANGAPALTSNSHTLRFQCLLICQRTEPLRPCRTATTATTATVTTSNCQR